MTSDSAAPGRFTITQAQRLRELGAPADALERVFADPATRDAAFREDEEALTRAGRECLRELRAGPRRPLLADLHDALSSALRAEGFVQVVTPHIISTEALRKMGIEHGHPLRAQVFLLEDGRALRPMLAPNLYTLMRRLGRVWRRPFGIFEIGACFRRDTQGGRHLNEFTMLNLVEVGLPEADARPRLDALAALVMKAAGIASYETVRSTSEVYGEMLDIEVGGVEVCSAGLGPHPLDGNWGIVEPWVGLGFGLERLLMAREGYTTIERAGRSLTYTGGVRLNL
jgi:phenylalanyl-tRNA synthetase alpha chain